MSRIALLAIRYSLFAILILPVHAADPPAKREVRAAWLTTFSGLDWPTTVGASPEAEAAQKAELIAILDRLHEAHFNTILLQVRARGDVFYRSRIEPWSDALVGSSELAPTYDPLEFAIRECHARGMECHAWLATIPLGSQQHVDDMGPLSPSRRRPDLFVRFGKSVFLNPGNPDTKEYLAALVAEIVDGYDVDGIHLDYIRYPERAPSFPDAREFRRYGQGKNKTQWRRDNITAIVRRIYHEVKSRKPWVKVSSSPVGKYDDTTRFPSRGWNALRSVNQDVRAWLDEGIQDQVYPMMYFRGNNFYPFALDWQEHACGRQIVAGLGIYFLDPKEGDMTLGEAERQIHFVRHYGLAGQAHYRTEFVLRDELGLYGLLSHRFYTAPALTPAMTWIDSIAPTAPAALTVTPLAEGYTRLTWQSATDDGPSPTYTLYGGTPSKPIDVNDPTHIVATGLRDTTYIYAPQTPAERYTRFAVTAVDRCGNESVDAAFSR